MSDLVSPCDVMQLLRPYVSIQQSLVALLAPSLAGASEFNPSTWPPRGTVRWNGDGWRYLRHGLGYRFENERDGLVVEAHTLLSRPDAFDAWRICCYCESRGVTSVSVGHHSVSVDEAALDRAFLQLVEEGALISWPGLPRRTYTLAG